MKELRHLPRQAAVGFAVSLRALLSMAREMAGGSRRRRAANPTGVPAYDMGVVVLKPNARTNRPPLDPAARAVILPFQRRANVLLEQSEPPVRTGSL